MIRLSRRSMLGGTAATVLMGRGACAQPAEFTYKLAHNQPTTHPHHMLLTQAANRIRADTGGKVDIQVFPNSQLGSDTDTLSQVRSGAVQFLRSRPSSFPRSCRKPRSPASPSPFRTMTRSGRRWTERWGPMSADRSRRQSVAMEKIWDNGFRQITMSNKAIQTAADLKGFKIRSRSARPGPRCSKRSTPLRPASTSTRPTRHCRRELSTARRTRCAIISAAKLYEVQKMLAHQSYVGRLLASGEQARLGSPPCRCTGDRRKHFNDAALVQRADVAKLNATLQTDLETKGMAFNKANSASFREALRKAASTPNGRDVRQRGLGAPREVCG